MGSSPFTKPSFSASALTSGDLNASRPILARLAFSALTRVVPSASMAALTARMRRAVSGLPQLKSSMIIAFRTDSGILASPPNMLAMAALKMPRVRSLTSHCSDPRVQLWTESFFAKSMVTALMPRLVSAEGVASRIARPLSMCLFVSAKFTKDLKMLLYPLTSSAMAWVLGLGGWLGGWAVGWLSGSARLHAGRRAGYTCGAGACGAGTGSESSKRCATRTFVTVGTSAVRSTVTSSSTTTLPKCVFTL